MPKFLDEFWLCEGALCQYAENFKEKTRFMPKLC